MDLALRRATTCDVSLCLGTEGIYEKKKNLKKHDYMN